MCIRDRLEDLGAADDAAERKNALSDGRLDRLDEAQSTDDSMSARLGLHRRFRRHADDALQRVPHTTITHSSSLKPLQSPKLVAHEI